MDPHSPCALLRACVTLLRVKDIIFSQHSARLGCYEGIEVVCTSKLPSGSGMGGSSILAACIIKAVSAIVNVTVSNEDLIYLVCMIHTFINTKICLNIIICSGKPSGANPDNWWGLARPGLHLY